MNNENANIVNLYKKLHKVKSEMGAVTKSANNPFFKSKYADLNAHLELVEPLLNKYGLVLNQPTIASQQLGNVVQSSITDIETGAQVSSSFALPKLEDMQKCGSAITYARRYTLGSLLAFQTDDDDGEKAVGRVTTKAAVYTNVKNNRDF
jgi:hypothetical protein